ncbi:unnamed protein product [Scytosiphon promiscuus]
MLALQSTNLDSEGTDEWLLACSIGWRRKSRGIAKTGRMGEGRIPLGERQIDNEACRNRGHSSTNPWWATASFTIAYSGSSVPHRLRQQHETFVVRYCGDIGAGSVHIRAVGIMKTSCRTSASNCQRHLETRAYVTLLLIWCPTVGTTNPADLKSSDHAFFIALGFECVQAIWVEKF